MAQRPLPSSPRDYHHLEAWSVLNNIQLPGARVESNIVDKGGGGLIATGDFGPGEVLVRVPPEMVLSVENVRDYARVDARFREIVQALEGRDRYGGGDFMDTGRGLILVFLTFQMTLAAALEQSPHDAGLGKESRFKAGVSTPLTNYVGFLPRDIPLPTFYSREERELLIGTSLAVALDQKLASLQKEFNWLKETTKHVEWCRKFWWDEDTTYPGGGMGLEDWTLADAMYRSRVLNLPRRVGDSMVPLVDMANHAPVALSNARFEVDPDGSVLLVVQDEKKVAQGDEITIVYGAAGACEMLFSYGFLEDDLTSAKEMFLEFNMPMDDPLRFAKISFSRQAPTIRFYVDHTGSLQWESPSVWWACVNEEDGLNFQLIQSNDGQKELQGLWKGKEMRASEMKSFLMEDKLRDIFVLRATVLIQQLVEEQGLRIAGSEPHYEQGYYLEGVRDATWNVVGKLRERELELLTLAYETLDVQKATLLDSDEVGRLIGRGPVPAERIVDDDFS